MLYALMIYVMACLVVGMIGANRKFGFWAYVFASMLFTPLVGMILVFASDSRPKPRYIPEQGDQRTSRPY